jgi:hypothetical protein
MEIWVSISQSIKWCQIRSYEGYEAMPELRVEGMDVSCLVCHVRKLYDVVLVSFGNQQTILLNMFRSKIRKVLFALLYFFI